MQDIPQRPPKPPILHKRDPPRPTRPLRHRKRGLGTIYRAPSINQLLECPPPTNPDEKRRPRRRTKHLAVLARPFLDCGGRIILGLCEGLVEEGPAADVWGEMGATGVAFVG
jgi:hypothetical protein